MNEENIARSGQGVEWHPLKPFLPKEGVILFLGSFPPARNRWSMDFYYPNFINDHWRIEGKVFHGEKQYFVDEAKKKFDIGRIINHCETRGIGFYDTATAIRRQRGNASDKFLEVVEATDIRTLVATMPKLRAIVVTGEKACETVSATLGVGERPGVGRWVEITGLKNGDGRQIELYRLPSSSRAYPLAFEKKAETYAEMFRRYGLLR